MKYTYILKIKIFEYFFFHITVRESANRIHGINVQ